MYMIDIETSLEHIKKPIYVGIMIVIYILYIGIYLGFSFAKPEYIHLLSKTVRLFICLFLIIRFHPFKQHYGLKDFDGELIFATAILMLTDLGIMQFFISDVKKRVTWGNVIQKTI